MVKGTEREYNKKIGISVILIIITLSTIYFLIN